MSDIVRFQGGGLSAATPGTAGGGLPFSGLAFDRPAVTFAELPTAWRNHLTAPATPSLGEVIAGGGRTAPKAIAAGADRYQLRYFWAAWPTQVAWWRVLRPLQARPDGRLQPAGEWQITEQTLWQVVGGPSQRATVVDDNTDPAAPTPAAPTPADPGTGNPVFEAGQFAQAALPSKVRLWLTQQIPDPTRWEGSVLRWDDNTDSVDVLRADSARIVVARATRPTGGLAWEIVRRQFTIVGSPAVTGGMPGLSTARGVARGEIGAR